MQCEKPPTSTKKHPKASKKWQISAKSATSSPKTRPLVSKRAKTSGAYYLLHSERLTATAKERYQALTTAERNLRRWRREAKPPVPVKGSKRHSNPRAAALAVAFCDFSDIEEVIRTYIACAIMNELDMGDYEVDHTVPVSSRLVCGLHTHTNLRVISHSENVRKGNFLWPQMWPLDWGTMDLVMASP
jgi:hypothetical protein